MLIAVAATKRAEARRAIQYYRQQVASLAEALNADENRAEAAELVRSLVDRIELTPNHDGKLDIDLFGDLAGILTLGHLHLRDWRRVETAMIAAGEGAAV